MNEQCPRLRKAIGGELAPYELAKARLEHAMHRAEQISIRDFGWGHRSLDFRAVRMNVDLV